MIRVVGLDVSLASTGIARLTVGDDGTRQSYSTTVGRELEATATVEQAAGRLDWARGAVLDEVAPPTGSGDARRTPDLVVMEGAAFSRGATAGADELAALRWFVLVDLYGLGVPFAIVGPTTLKVYACGAGGSKKTPVTKLHVITAARRHYPDLWDLGPGPGLADRADSAVLAAMGARHLGAPVDELPSTHTRALKSVRWPVNPSKES